MWYAWKTKENRFPCVAHEILTLFSIRSVLQKMCFTNKVAKAYKMILQNQKLDQLAMGH